jgi:hypothetical protein
MLMTTHAAPETACLWEVDLDGIAVGKPIKWNAPLQEVHDCYRDIVAKGHTESRFLRITPAGRRPDPMARK